MNQKRTNQSNSIGNLFASNIFPLNVNATSNQRNVAQRSSQRKTNVKVTRLERLTFTQNVENHTSINAVYPYINKEAMAMTMDNYRSYVANYNENVYNENENIRIHNAKVVKYIDNTELTEVQKTFTQMFYLKNNKLDPKKFNDLADEFNQEYGLLIEKKRFATIKYATELVFQQLVYIYSMQLAKSSNEYMKLGVKEATPLKQLAINSWQVATMKRNEIQAIDVCKATIRNHRSRLEEAGILVEYTFRGNKSAVKMTVNSQILVVFDASTGKFSNAENQSLTSGTHKDLTNKDEATRPLQSNIKKIENGIAAFLEKGTPSAATSSVFLLEHPKQKPNLNNAAAEKSVKISEKLENSILDQQEFAVKLSSGEFNNYQRIDKRILYHEAAYGTMNRHDFKELIIQEFFKNAAKLYRGKTVFVGSWKKAINSYLEKLFTVNNGNSISLYNKELMVDKLDQMIWRINNAQRWFTKTKINPLFPSDYFDFTRKTKSEIGFEYTQKAYENHIKYLENKPRLEKSIKKKAAIRENSINNDKKFQNKLNQFFRNRLTLEEFIDYVSNNLPSNYMQKLTENLISISTKYTC
ncbi:hypothetical protein [Flavobacterium capsici]|uniref:Uncharacterized protein n=1 Tax=Flavobacterium capsici TaxID=3075618 RepID=A0AA96F0R7_9FLAO|nr:MULTISPECIES: hypothetical protein [unclassified Flavobacterium]WNM19256.1 hypothetical protein RN608_00905 [Flavobacterium sp. PMR2A8]WNM20645.1 hypothetical protein RN605_08075 [Flavobacterium sp. PMTSA4]